MKSDDDHIRIHVGLTKGMIVSYYRIAEKFGTGGMGDSFIVIP